MQSPFQDPSNLQETWVPHHSFSKFAPSPRNITDLAFNGLAFDILRLTTYTAQTTKKCRLSRCLILRIKSMPEYRFTGCVIEAHPRPCQKSCWKIKKATWKDWDAWDIQGGNSVPCCQSPWTLIWLETARLKEEAWFQKKLVSISALNTGASLHPQC